jgi:hypothetical protein
MSALTSATWRSAAAALCLLGAASLAQGQPAAPATMPAEKVAPALLPAEVPATNAAVGSRYRCGGIGSDESIAMRAQMKEHPLSLLFAQPGGAYLADIDVTIQGTQSVPALTFRASGPVCLVDLPAGSYAVQATSGGVTKKQQVTVTAGAPKTVDFRF